MADWELNVELLLNRRVWARNGRPIGRLEEICAELRDGHCVVVEYRIGAYAYLDRLAAWHIGRSVLRVLGAHGYRVPWDKLDLEHATKPTLNCRVSELERWD